ncbi:MAG: glutathione S-transferase family protein [Acidobacteria bacterium]|nr:glutathione S-transferase family protein [Acidobacteriota bacterium]
MKLVYTPRSHFSRKVRILLDAWRVHVDVEDAGDVSAMTTHGQHPLMRVPTLIDGETAVFESDHIARYLTKRHDPTDRFGVLCEAVDQVNATAVMNGVMAAEVELILAKRTGIPIEQYVRFDKHLKTIQQGLAWLEHNSQIFPATPCYRGFHLVCLWDHLAFYDTISLEYPKLLAIVSNLSQLPYVAKSAPV